LLNDTIKVTYEITRKAVEEGIFKGEEAYGIMGRDLFTGENFRVESVSFNKVFAEKLALLLAKNQVSIVHAKDVIKDLVDVAFIK